MCNGFVMMRVSMRVDVDVDVESLQRSVFYNCLWMD